MPGYIAPGLIAEYLYLNIDMEKYWYNAKTGTYFEFDADHIAFLIDNWEMMGFSRKIVSRRMAFKQDWCRIRIDGTGLCIEGLNLQNIHLSLIWMNKRHRFELLYIDTLTDQHSIALCGDKIYQFLRTGKIMEGK